MALSSWDVDIFTEVGTRCSNNALKGEHYILMPNQEETGVLRFGSTNILQVVVNMLKYGYLMKSGSDHLGLKIGGHVI